MPFAAGIEPACPFCRTPFGAEAIQRARDEGRLQPKEPERVDLEAFDIFATPSPASADFVLAKALSNVWLECPKQHRTSGLYVLGAAPTYLISLVGLRNSGKTHLLTALARFALSEASAVWGYSVSIGDRESEAVYQRLVNTLFRDKVPIPFSTNREPLGLRFVGHGRSFNLLFIDIPGETLDTEESMSESGLHLTDSDLALCLVGCDILVDALIERRAGSSANEPAAKTADLFQRYQSLLERAARSSPDVTSKFMIVLSKADRVLTYAAPDFAEMIGDAGLLKVPADFLGRVSTISYDYLQDRPGRSEWSAIFWQSLYARIALRTGSPKLLLATSALPSPPLYAFVSSTGGDSQSAAEGGMQSFATVEPMGVASILTKILSSIGVVNPPEELNPSHAAAGWMRQLSLASRSTRGST